MSFGLSFTGASGQVVIDSQYARLCVISSGTFSGGGGVDCSVTFPVPVTTQEPPLVFLQPTNNGGIATLQWFQVTGSAGNWTGFYVRSTNSNYSPLGKWFCAAFAAQAIAPFGLRLFDATGKLILDSDTPTANFTRAVQDFTYVKSTTIPGIAGAANYYSLPFTFNNDEYQMMNNFGMLRLDNQGSQTGRYMASWWDFADQLLYCVVVGSSNSFDFHASSIFGRITG